MSRPSLLVSLVASACALAALLPPSAVEAQPGLRVRIEPAEEGAHVVSRVIGQRIVPHHSSYRVGGWRYHTVETRFEDVWAPLCNAPCTTIVPEEPTRLAIDGIAIDVPFLPMEGATIRLLADRRGVHRGIGGLVYALGLLGAGGLITSIVLDNDLRTANLGAMLSGLFDEDDELARWISAGATILVTQVVGLVLMGLRDTARIDMVPGGFRF